jgi:hypothetical protein
MIKSNNRGIVSRMVGTAVGVEIACLVLILIFTKSVIYCIISLTGAAITIIGFVLLIRSTDRLLKKGKGKAMFFLLAPAKLIVIAGTFYLFDRLASGGSLFFIQGVVVMYLSVTIVALAHWAGNSVHGT